MTIKQDISMKKRSLVPMRNVALLLFLFAATQVMAAEVRVLSTLAIKEVMEDLEPKFERATGHKLVLAFGSSGAIAKRFKEGEAADVVITSRQAIDSFVKDGKLVASSVAVLASASVGVAVRKGAPKPDISTPEALKRALLAARSITYSNPAGGGASGIHFAKVLDFLGITDEMKAKTVFLPKSGPVAVLVAGGEAELGVQQLQELLPVEGIDVVGLLPAELQLTNVVSAAITSSAGDAAASRALVDFMRTPEAATVIKAKGMEPITAPREP